MTNASTPSVTVSEGQARKLVDQLKPGLVEAIMVGKLPHDRFQFMLQQEKNLKIRSRFVQFLRDILAEIIEMVAIHSSYQPNAIAMAIDENHFDATCLNLAPEQIPLMGSGEVEHEVSALHLNEYLTTREVMAKVDERDFKFADPLTTLLYALKLPDRQRQYPIITLFEVNGQLWYLLLEGDVGGRDLRVDRYDLDGRLNGRCRFLVVLK